MADETKTMPECAEEKEGEGEAVRSPRMRRVRTFVKDHPVVMLAGAAAVGAVTGVEWAAGALIGMAAASLLGDRRGLEWRDRMLRRGREVLERKHKAEGVAAGAQAGESHG